MQWISLHEPEFDELDEQSVLGALRSAWVSTGGPLVDEFELEFARYVGTDFAVSVSNGTLGLSLMITALARMRGVDGRFSVLVPNLTFIATANAVVHAGGMPVFFDTSPGCLNATRQQIEETLERSFRKKDGHWEHKETALPLLAVMPAHIMGWRGGVPEIAQFCSTEGLTLLEDACESLGSFSCAGEHFGKHGLASGFSFNGNKILTTGGGGMIVTDNVEFGKRLKHLSTTAKTDGLRFIHDEVGYNYRLVNILAALGCTQLKKLPARLARKKEIFALYAKCLERETDVSVYQEPDCLPNNWLVNLVFSSEQHRERALRRLNSSGVQARPLWTLNHLQPAYSSFVGQSVIFPNSSDMWKRCLSVPSSPQLSNAQIEQICMLMLSES
jgi:perosamine synthetase